MRSSCLEKKSPRRTLFPAVVRKTFQQHLRAYRLTPREEQVVSQLLQGLTNKEIAARDLITEQTVKDHLKHAYRKIGVHQRIELLARVLGTALS